MKIQNNPIYLIKKLGLKLALWLPWRPIFI